MKLENLDKFIKLSERAIHKRKITLDGEDLQTLIERAGHTVSSWDHFSPESRRSVIVESIQIKKDPSYLENKQERRWEEKQDMWRRLQGTFDEPSSDWWNY